MVILDLLRNIIQTLLLMFGVHYGIYLTRSISRDFLLISTSLKNPLGAHGYFNFHYKIQLLN
jgi:hypothetical protein